MLSGPDAELGLHRVRVHELPLAPVVGHDAAVLADALRHVLVRRQDHHPLDAGIVGPARGRGGQRVVGLELDHRPDDAADGPQRVLDERELRQQLGRHAGLGLVAGEPLVAPRADHVVRGAAEVRDAVLAEQRQDALDHAQRAADRLALGIRRAAGARNGHGRARRWRRGGGSACADGFESRLPVTPGRRQSPGASAAPGAGFRRPAARSAPRRRPAAVPPLEPRPASFARWLRRGAVAWPDPEVRSPLAMRRRPAALAVDPAFSMRCANAAA